MSAEVEMDIAKFINAMNDTPEFPWLSGLKMASDGVGNNLYVNDMPPTPDYAFAIRPYPGTAPTETFRNPVAIRHPRIQIEVRDKKSNVVLARARDLIKILSVVKDQTINGTKYSRIRSIGEPIELGPDSSGRQRATVNFEASYYDTV